MIEESYVSFEVAKLLKERGFDWEDAEIWYASKKFSTGCHWNSCTYNVGEMTLEYEEGYCISCPTLQMVIKWLEEVHHILVVPDYVYECTSTSWVYKIYRLGENGKPERCVVKGVSYDENNNPTEHITGYRDYELSYKDYATREEAEDEGIRYVLEKYV